MKKIGLIGGLAFSAGIFYYDQLQRRFNENGTPLELVLMHADVKKVLNSAIANAENNHGLDVDSLIVSEAYVGKNFVMKRFRARARGRGARILKPFSELTIVVKEVEEQEAA